MSHSFSGSVTSPQVRGVHWRIEKVPGLPGQAKRAGPHFGGVHAYFPDLLEGTARTAVTARGVKMEGSLPKVSSTLSIRTDSRLQSSLGDLKREGPSVGISMGDPTPSLRLRGVANKTQLWPCCVVSGAKPELAQGHVRTNSRSTIYQA